MSHNVKIKTKRQKRRRSPILLLTLLLLWSLVVGWGLARVAYSKEIPPIYQSANPPMKTLAEVAIGTVDPIPQGLQLGQELYLENCANCHIALPPAVMPNETWRRLLKETQHYGVQLNLPSDPSRVLMWNYLRTFSRSYADDETLPYKLEESRYFKALHPRVKLPRPVSVNTCVTCHPGAGEYNFRSLSPEWQDSP